MRRIIFTVTNDLNTDQRMIRICTSLKEAGYDVLLIGRRMKQSAPLSPQAFRQQRMPLLFQSGKLFYAEYNLRLFILLLFTRADAICAIDLDSIIPCYLVSAIKGIRRVYDAHELFCEMQEIVERPAIYRWWKRIERWTVPRFRHGYTVNDIIASEFEKMYGVRYQTIRSIAVYEAFEDQGAKQPFIIYQGAVNKGRCFEELIPAMLQVDAPLIICGDGNFFEAARQLAAQPPLSSKIVFRGRLLPDDLRTITRSATIGVTLFESKGKSNYFSLANRFFDYLHAGIPQVCVDYPEYRTINNLHEVAVLIETPDKNSIAAALNKLLHEPETYERLKRNCQQARLQMNWQEEEKKLIAFYRQLFSE